ncbi:MAG: ATP-binding protein [Chloroherpetonaceae bacterium]|nr:ATP-binding protein [Chloroherpetonaceae bacterium]
MPRQFFDDEHNLIKALQTLKTIPIRFSLPLINFAFVCLIALIIFFLDDFFLTHFIYTASLILILAVASSALMFVIIDRLKNLQTRVIEMNSRINAVQEEISNEETYSYEQLSEAIRARTEELLFTELQYRSLFDSTAEIILICDDAFQPKEMNRTGEIFFDVSRDNLQGFDFFQSLQPNDRERVLQAVEETRSGSISKTEIKLYNSKNVLSIFLAEFSPLVYANAAFSGFKVLMQNITYEKEEQLAREAIIRTTSIVENATNFTDAAQELVRQFGEIFSPSIIFIYSFNKAEERLTLTNTRDFDNPNLLQKVSTYQTKPEEIGIAVKTALEQKEIIVENVQSQPSLHYLVKPLKELNAQSLYSLPLVASKELLGVLQVLTIQGKKITSSEMRLARVISSVFSENLFKRNLMKALAVANKTLAQKNADLENFVYSVSHDLRAPLISIQGFSSQIQEMNYEQMNYDSRYCLERIRYNAKNMEDMVVELLELSRVSHENVRYDIVDTYKMVQSIAENYWGEYSSKKTIIDIATDLPQVRYPRRRIEQVLTNLIGNAVRYTSNSETPHIIVGVIEADFHWEFYVKDNGIGINPDDHERVFKIFERLNPNGQGSGVGLAIVKKIIEQYGGKIWIISDLGEGTEMHFTVPKHNE